MIISDADLVGDTDYYWTADNIYELDKLVFLEAGSRLFIEPGTRIEGSTGSNLDASALVITRGAQIFAEVLQQTQLYLLQLQMMGLLTKLTAVSGVDL